MLAEHACRLANRVLLSDEGSEKHLAVLKIHIFTWKTLSQAGGRAPSLSSHLLARGLHTRRERETAAGPRLPCEM